MDSFKSFEEVLYDVNDDTFDEIALRLFHFQARRNPLYSDFLRYLGVNPMSVGSVQKIPFLPVSFFKTHAVRTGEWQPQVTFTSSGTTGTTTARHDIPNLELYRTHARRAFDLFYGSPSEVTILALLPSYSEREGSSLIAMIEDFIRQNPNRSGGFFHRDPRELVRRAESLKGQKVLVWGVAYALLDLAETDIGSALSHCVIMETGGMKGRRKEITREELHRHLTSRLGVDRIHSEYGMTELMSQAYSPGEGLFFCPPWMRVVLRDPEDPLDISPARRRGGINIIDLANIYSCGFIETQDLGKMAENGGFEVLGRLDNSDIRGCNLLVE